MRNQATLTLSVLAMPLAICRLASDRSMPAWVETCPFYSVTRTDEELSLVVPGARVPAEWTAPVERGWRALKVHGPLDFGLTGILASLSGALADAGVSIFAISTYDTDYVLVRNTDLSRALAALRERGHTIANDSMLREGDN